MPGPIAFNYAEHQQVIANMEHSLDTLATQADTTVTTGGINSADLEAARNFLSDLQAGTFTTPSSNVLDALSALGTSYERNSPPSESSEPHPARAFVNALGRAGKETPIQANSLEQAAKLAANGHANVTFDDGRLAQYDAVHAEVDYQALHNVLRDFKTQLHPKNVSLLSMLVDLERFARQLNLETPSLLHETRKEHLPQRKLRDFLLTLAESLRLPVTSLRTTSDSTLTDLGNNKFIQEDSRRLENRLDLLIRELAQTQASINESAPNRRRHFNPMLWGDIAELLNRYEWGRNDGHNQNLIEFDKLRTLIYQTQRLAQITSTAPTSFHATAGESTQLSFIIPSLGQTITLVQGPNGWVAHLHDPIGYGLPEGLIVTPASAEDSFDDNNSQRISFQEDSEGNHQAFIGEMGEATQLRVFATTYGYASSPASEDDKKKGIIEPTAFEDTQVDQMTPDSWPLTVTLPPLPAAGDPAPIVIRRHSPTSAGMVLRRSASTPQALPNGLINILKAAAIAHQNPGSVAPFERSTLQNALSQAITQVAGEDYQIQSPETVEIVTTALLEALKLPQNYQAANGSQIERTKIEAGLKALVADTYRVRMPRPTHARPVHSSTPRPRSLTRARGK